MKQSKSRALERRPTAQAPLAQSSKAGERRVIGPRAVDSLLLMLVRAFVTICATVAVACHPTHATQTRSGQALPPNCPRADHLKVFTVHTVGSADPAEDGLLATEDLMLSPSLNWDLYRSGKSIVVYTVDICGGNPPAIGDVKQRTPFPELDQILAERVPALSANIQPGICTITQLRVTGWNDACDWPVAAL